MRTDLETDKISNTALSLSIVEVGLGSLIHSIKLPLGGHLLSLNQGLWLSRLTQSTKTRSSAIAASNIVAILKSLSPAGKRLTPMMAISIQGLAFAAGTGIVGTGVIGTSLGMFFLSAWGFIQPLLLYYFLFGGGLLKVVDYFLTQLSPLVSLQVEDLFLAVGVLFLIKSMVGVFANLLMSRWSDSEWTGFFEKWMKKAPEIRPIAMNSESSQNSNWKISAQLAFKDLRNPFFLFTLALAAIFVFATEPAWVDRIWFLLRPLALGFLLFWMLRLGWMERFLKSKTTAKENTFMKALNSTYIALMGRQKT